MFQDFLWELLLEIMSKISIDGYNPRPRFEATCCIWCEHFDGKEKGTCKAFPKGIPNRYAIRNQDMPMEYHTSVDKDQNGKYV